GRRRRSDSGVAGSEPAVRTARPRPRAAHDARGESLADDGPRAGDRAAGHPRVQLVERGSPWSGALGTRDRLSAGDRLRRDVGRQSRVPHGHGHLRRVSGQASRLRAARRAPALSRPHRLVAQHQPVSRPALGTRAGDVRRRPVSHRPDGGPVHPRVAGRRSQVLEDHRDREAFRRALWAGALRHEFDAVVSERDLRESYLPHFETGIREAGAYSLMCAYNRVFGSPACGSALLLRTILRGEWRFPGYVVSDCGAIDDIYQRHRVAPTAAAAAALGVRTGTDLDCGREYANLVDAVHQGLISEQAIDTAVTRLFVARFRLGMFDPPAAVRWAQIPISVLDQRSHRALALQVARESMVLLKNARN